MTRSLARPTIETIAAASICPRSPVMKKPSGAELRGGLLRHPPIAAEHVRPLDLDHADLALRQGAPVSGSPMRSADAGQRKAHRAGDPLARRRGSRCSCWSRSCRSARGWRGRCASRQSRWVSASSGAEPEMNRRMCAASPPASGRDRRAAACRRSARPSATSPAASRRSPRPASKRWQEDHRRAGQQARR